MIRKTSLFVTLAVCPFLIAGMALAQDGDPADREPPSIEEIVAKKIERLTRSLELTDEQIVPITQLLTNSTTQERALQDAIRALREETQENMTVVLTDEQTERVEQMKKRGKRGRGGPGMRGQRGRGGEGHRGGRERGMMHRIGEEIGVTEEQHDAIRDLIEDEDISMREAIDQVLTDEQKAQLEELREARRGDNEDDSPRGPRRRGGRGGRGPF